MKIACVYHSVDLDGYMSAAIVKHWFNLENNGFNTIPENNTIDFIGYNYGQPIPDLSEYDKVIMCDISFPKEKMYKLYERLKDNFIWIDHHISAIKDNVFIDDNICKGHKYNGIRDVRFAACELTWKYFFPNEKMPEIVRLLGRYDCFGHKGTDEERKVLEFQYGARQIISNYEEAYSYLTMSIEHIPYEPRIEEDIQHAGKAIYKYLCIEAKQTYKNGFEINIGQNPNVKLIDITTIPDTKLGTLKHAVGTFLPYKFLCLNKERFNPINFGIDYHKDGYDGCMCFYMTADKHVAISLYNDNGLVDCSVIAKQFGGGGHKGASGFVMTNEQFKNLISNI